MLQSSSRNDVPRVAQRYETMATHTRCRATVLVVFVVFLLAHYSFAGLIRRTPPQTFSDTAITDRHSDTTIFQLSAHWVRISWSVGSEKSFAHVPPVGVNPRLPVCRPDRVAQSVGHMTRKSEVLGSIPGLATYFRFSFRWFKRGSCQLLVKVYARSTG